MSEEGEFDEVALAGDPDAKAEDEEEDEEEGEREDKEMLFLIEFLVDTLCINTKNLNTRNIDPCMLDGQTCVVLTFLNFPPMSICEKDWGPENEDTTEDTIKFNAGKSLMFALSESQFGNPPPIYLEVSAHKVMPHGLPESKFPIGVTKICLSELFKQVFDKVDEKPDKLPLSKSIKDTYHLMGNRSRKPTAEIVIYVRLSCLGQNVVTEFQRGNDECEPFLFKNKESNKVYECKAKDDLSDEDVVEVCPPCPGWGDTREKAKACFAEAEPRSDYAEDEDEYEEFGTEVHGHALTIKIQKSRKSGKEETSDMCICDSKANKSGKGSGPGNQVTFQVPQDQSLCKAGLANNKATVHNLKGCEDGGIVKLSPGNDESEDKDIFVLRIGKKGEVNGKGKLELELRTPKQKLDKGPKGPKMVDREAQTDREESPKKGKKKK